MDFPLVNAVLAGVPDAQPNEASDISGLKAAVQEPGLKYKEFDNLDLLPGKLASEVVNNAPKEAASVMGAQSAPSADPLKNIFSAAQSNSAHDFATFTKPVSPPASAAQAKRVEGKSIKQQPLRDAFAFLAGRQANAQPAASLRDIFR